MLLLALALVLVPMITAQDSPCGAGLQCVATAECESYQLDSDQLRQLRSSSSEYRQLLARLKQLVCSRQPRKVCCSPSPRKLPAVDGRE